MCINDLQGSHEGYAQKIALKKEAKVITNGIMRCSLSTTAHLSGKTKSLNIHRYEVHYLFLLPLTSTKIPTKKACIISLASNECLVSSKI